MAYEISLFPELIEGALVGSWTTPVHLMQASAVSVWDEAGRFIHSRMGVELPFQSSEAYFPFSCLNPRLCLPALYSDFRSDFSLLPILYFWTCGNYLAIYTLPFVFNRASHPTLWLYSTNKFTE